MLSWMTVPFLFVPGKRPLLVNLLVLFYFFAGILKIDPASEWLSGGALYNREKMYIPEELIPLSLYYVVAMELLLVFGVYAQNKWIYWSTFLQLVLFHIMSYPIVGFFYPALMFCLISILPLTRFLAIRPSTGDTDKPPQTSPVIQMTRGMSFAGWVFILIYFAAQGFPHTFPGKSSMTGEGRFLGALHMFDARVKCKANAIFKTTDGREIPRNIFRQSPQYLRLSVRIGCDPIVIIAYANDMCEYASQNKKGDFTLSLKSSTWNEEKYYTIIDWPNYCSNNVSYNLFTHNDWILSLPPNDELVNRDNSVKSKAKEL